MERPQVLVAAVKPCSAKFTTSLGNRFGRIPLKNQWKSKSSWSKFMVGVHGTSSRNFSWEPPGRPWAGWHADYSRARARST